MICCTKLLSYNLLICACIILIKYKYEFITLPQVYSVVDSESSMAHLPPKQRQVIQNHQPTDIFQLEQQQFSAHTNTYFTENIT